MGSIDTMFESLSLVESSWATMLAGFFIVLIILFLAVKVFGMANQQLNSFGFMIMILLSIILVTAIGLFPIYILILFVILGLAAVLLKGLIFGGQHGE